MYSRQEHASPALRKIGMFILAILLVWTAAPLSPAKASTGPEILPIYVGMNQFNHLGNDANVSGDSTRGLLFPSSLNGPINSATTANGRLRVVPVTNGSSGIVVRTNKIKLDGGFSTYFVMHLNGSTSLDNTSFPGPADGLTFIIQDNPQPRIGGIGEGVGFTGIPNSIGVEFDTWKNAGQMGQGYYYDPNSAFSRTNKYHPVNNPNGPTADHVAIVVNGVNTHAQGSGDVVDNLQGAKFRLYDYANSNAYIHVWVDYDDDGNLKTTYGLSANRTNPDNRSISRNVGKSLMNKEVYVGFGASTGGANSHHDILGWYFKNSYVEGGLDPNGNYKQGPIAVKIDKDTSSDGSVTGLDIKVKGNNPNVNLPDEEVDIYINNQLVDGEFSTDNTGKLIYTFDESSHLQAGNNTIKVITRGGGTSGNASVIQTVKPENDDIVVAVTERGVVTADHVPNDVTVTLYNENNEVIVKANPNSKGTARIVLTIAQKEKLAEATEIKVGYSKAGEVPSVKVPVTPLNRSDAPEEDSVVTNATDNTVTVKKVPPGTTVNVYDENDEVIGWETNSGPTEQDIVITINSPTVLKKGDKVKVSTEEDQKMESERVPSIAKLVSESPAPDRITANATDNKVTVKDVPPGTTVNVYDNNGELIGTATNTGSTVGEVVVTISEPHVLQENDIVNVTFKLPEGLESLPTSSTVMLESNKPAANDVFANATDNTVTVKRIPPGTTVNVYDENDVLIGTATNNGSSEEDIVVVIQEPITLHKDDKVKVSTKETGKLESKRTLTEAELVSDTPAQDKIAANATDNKVTVKVVPPGTTVNVYNESGELIGTATNTDSTVGEVVVTINEPHVLQENDIVNVTFTMPDSLESQPVPSQARLDSDMPAPNNVLVSISKGTVTVEEVPEGATVIIYDENGEEWKTGTNPGSEKGPVVISELDLQPGTKITVTIIERNKFESKPLSVEAAFTSEEAIDDALKKLQIGYHEDDTWESVTHPVFIVSAGENNTQIQWTSSKPASIEVVSPGDNTIETKVHRRDKDESVILTASISKNGVTKNKTFLLIVKADNVTKSTVTNYRTVKVVGGSSEEVKENTRIDRISISNGVKIDKAILDAAAAARFVNDARTRNGVSTIFVDEIAGDEPGEIAVEVPRQSVDLLSGNGNTLDVRTEYATVSIAATVLEQMADNYLDLFFRLIPVKDANQQAQISTDIANEEVVKTAAGNRDIVVVGSSLEIETNYRDYATKLFLPFAKNGITLPAENAGDFLTSLRVFVEHSDGEKVVKTGTVIYDGDTPIGLEIEIDKFSVFTIVQLKNRPVFGPIVTAPTAPSTETKPQGVDQVKKASVDADKGIITLDLASGSNGVDKSGFTVKVGNQTVEIKEISISGGQVTITLKDSIPPGYEAVISYKPGSSSATGDLTAFTDLKVSNPAHHIAYIKGFPDGTFRPDKTVTRAEMSAILARNKNLAEVSPYQQLYPDVPQGHWAASSIEQLKDVGLLIGDSNGNFRPGDRITRAEMAMVAARWLSADLEAEFQSAFGDVSASHWAAAAIAAVSEAGIMIGFEDGTFGLQKYVTRAQAVTIMNRLLGRGPLTGVPAPTWPDSGSHWASEHIEEASQDHDYTYLPDGKELLYQN